MTLNRIKVFATALVILPAIGVVVFNSGPVKAVSTTADDAAADYKAKCAACHSPTASKFFDPSVKDEELVQFVLKGKKGEKPPYMPAFESKGMTEEQAKALVGYMKGLRASAPK
jgi:mono/diheme cytochrome c family protein